MLWLIRDSGGGVRKVRDYDAEMKALDEKVRALKAERVLYYGQLVLATKANELDEATLAGLLIAGISPKYAAAREGWRTQGEAFFRKRATKPRRSPAHDSESLDEGAGRQAAARG